MQHEFEFSGLKVTKPSRMRKVYMLFCCRIFESDTLFVAYHVPTIVIAHITNQGARALNTLLGHVEREVGDEGDDASEGELGQGGGRSQVSRKRQPDADVGVSNYHGVVGVATPAASHGTVRQTGSQGTVRQTGSHGTANSHLASLNDPLNAPQPPGWLPDSQVGHMSASRWPQNQDAFNMSRCLVNPMAACMRSSVQNAELEVQAGRVLRACTWSRLGSPALLSDLAACSHPSRLYFKPAKHPRC